MDERKLWVSAADDYSITRNILAKCSHCDTTWRSVLHQALEDTFKEHVCSDSLLKEV